MSSSWYKGSEGNMSSTGTYSADSDLAKEYSGLSEDGDSRVDDEEGWREIHRDNTPGSPEEYSAMVKDYAAKGFDVKAIDMDGDNFEHANFAIKPMGEDSGGEAPADSGPIKYSPELQAAHDRVNQWTEDVWSGQTSNDIYGQREDRFDERSPAQQQEADSIADGRFDDGNRQQKEAAQLFANNAVDKVKDMLANANQI